MKKPLNIFMINYDWRDIFRTSFVELHDKLERDQLGPDYNKFFFLSWANVSYMERNGLYETWHIRTRLYKLKPLLDFITIFKVREAVKRFALKSDAWLTYDFGMLPALRLAKKAFGGKVVLCVSSQPHLYSKTRRFGAIKGLYSWLGERLWWRLADHFFTINENMKSYLMNIGIPANRITVFYVNTIDRDMRYIAAAAKGKVRAEYAIPASTKILLTVARLESEKNYPKLLELFAGLGPGYVLVALGRGSLLDTLKDQAKRLGIENRLIFPGFIHRDDIWNYYADADAFVLLSQAEALGLVFWEAMHMNVPVIGSAADGIVETIGEDGLRGRIWREIDGQEGFNERVKFAVRPSPERDAMLVRARQFVDRQRQNKVTFNDVPVFEA
ncbi:MAG: glycosyltransferase family 4 protein [Patescibacteria group bacterium]|nr:glycosyltransferase family 4 protein [Patescibacteria group bacterium]MDE2172820.1 glycosyltransferase family 4 protein [Patescibacteria group bacterium]